jgi:hypothetical protein
MSTCCGAACSCVAPCRRSAGATVWGEPKTHHGSRDVLVPKWLRSQLAPLFVGLGPDDLIFGRQPFHGAPWKGWDFRRRVFDQRSSPPGSPPKNRATGYGCTTCGTRP